MQRISLRHDLTLDNGKGRVIKIYITRYDITRFYMLYNNDNCSQYVGFEQKLLNVSGERVKTKYTCEYCISTLGQR